jgi:hypothetical protein
LVLLAATAWGLTKNPQCVQDGAKEKQACIQTCKENFQAAKDTCWNVDHDCMESCRAGRVTCVTPIYTALKTCIDGCRAALDTAKADCRAWYTEGTPERDTCIDQAQVLAFSCRDGCWESRDKPALTACRKAFLSCRNACPPAAN